MNRRPTLLLVAVLVCTLLPWSAARAQDDRPTGLPQPVVQAKVSSYVDGDKIKVDLDGERVELNFIGADAPEPKECYATEANAAIRKLLPKGTVLYLQPDAVQADENGRILRHVWAEGKGGEAYLVNAKLIRDGIAGWKKQDADDGNAKYADRYEKAQADAQESKNGLWAECSRLHSKARTKSAQATSETRADAQRATEAAAPDPTRAPTMAPPVAGEGDYLTDLQGDQAVLLQSFVELDAFIANPSSDTEAFFNVVVVLATWQVTYDEWQGRDAAPGFEDVHAEWQLGLSLLDSAADQIADGVDNGNQDRINEGVLNYLAGRGLVEGLSGRI